ncbi:MAG: ferritin-like domain-containing protein [Bacillota bacterium]
MKKQLFPVSLTLFLLLIMTTPSFSAKPENYGAKGALIDPELSLAKALTYAIEDEYFLNAKYDKVMDTFGHIPPFTQMKVLEQRHIYTLLPLLKKYNIDVPKDDAKEYVHAPKSIKVAFQDGVSGEIDNIAMYDKLASIKEFPEDILSIFNQLGTDSKNHLDTFKRGLQQ